MLRRIAVTFIFCACSSQITFAQSSPSTSPAPTPPTPEQIQAAQTQGTAVGNQVGGQVSGANQQGLSTQSTSYSTLENSSLDTMMNSQLGQASSVMMSSSLARAAGPYATSCDPSSASGVEACATGSVLTGMSGQMTRSSSSYEAPINLAWSNVCQFSTIGCGAPVVPNPYTPIVQTFTQTNPSVYQDLLKKFEDKGYVIDPSTGVVKTPDGQTIDPNNQKSIDGAVGAAGSKALQQILDRMQKDIANRLSRVKRDSYLHTLGLGNLKDLSKKMRDAIVGRSDSAKEKEEHEKKSKRQNYNRLPEKEREKVEITELVKSYNGTPIGVAAANIFKMVKKRYEIKASQKVFLPPEFKPQKVDKNKKSSEKN